MLVGVPKEIKPQENRVGLVPGSVHELTLEGHEVIVETGAGEGIGISDEAYLKRGATIAETAAEIFAKAEIIVKVKEPQLSECRMLRQGQTLFTYLHLAPDLEQALGLQASGCTAIAYETVTNSCGGLPLLQPMSQVAGRLSIQAGVHCLEAHQGGSGILLGGVPGVAPANVVVIGGGIVGTNAIRMAKGLEAYVTVLDTSLDRLQALDLQFGSKINTIYSTNDNIEEYVARADLLIGGVLLPGAASPKLVTRDMLKSMRKGSVIVDVAIDQGGCMETSRPTTHENPTYVEEGVVHYCVTNMPAVVPRTSTFALNNATLPFVKALTNKGVKQALLEDIHLRAGLNVHSGKLTHPAVAMALQQDYLPSEEALKLA